MIDDDPSFRETLGLLLISAGYEVKTHTIITKVDCRYLQRLSKNPKSANLVLVSY